MILYILIFTDGTHFKVGHSDHQNNRIESLQKTYRDFGMIDYDRSWQVSGPEDEIRKLENQLKFDYCKHFSHGQVRDGYTETCAIEYLEDVLHDVDVKVSKLWKRLSLAPLQRVPEKPIKIPKARVVKFPRVQSYEQRFNVLDFLKHPYGQHVIQLTKEGKKEVSLAASEMPNIFRFVYHMKDAENPKVFNGNYFPTVLFYFKKGTEERIPDRVVIHVSSAFLEDVTTGALDCNINHHDLNELIEPGELPEYPLIDAAPYHSDFDNPEWESELEEFRATIRNNPKYSESFLNKLNSI